MNKIYVNGSNKFKSTLVSINYLLDVNKEEISYFSHTSLIISESVETKTLSTLSQLTAASIVQ